MRNILKFPKLSTKDICAIAMLIAITVILAIYCTFRVGEVIKIPFKFIPVFVAAALFGPWIGGLCSAMGDFLNATLVPVGAMLPQLTALEFLSGFVFGLFFFRQKTSGKGYILRCVLCVFAQFLTDMLLTTAVLVSVGYFPDFSVAFLTRISAGIVKAGIQLAVLLSGTIFLNPLKKIRR